MTDYGKFPDGTVVTEEIIEELSAEAERGYDLSKADIKRVGRPSLARGVSPRVNFRIAAALHARALARAEQEGKTLSELAREALETYVNNPK